MSEPWHVGAACLLSTMDIVLETYEGVVRALRFPYDTYFCWFEEEDEEEEEEESNCTIYIIRCRPNA